MTQLTIGLISGNSDDQCIESNYDTLKKVVYSYDRVDVFCAGELFLIKDTYELENAQMWIKLEEILTYIQELSKEKSCAICVGYPHQKDHGISIRQSVFFPKGEAYHYDKVHLGKKESEHFVSGDRIDTFDYKGFCIGLQLCIDTHVQEMTLMQKLKGVELILAPFNTPYSTEKRLKNWKKYILARAYEYNLCFACTNTGGGIIGGNGHGHITCLSSEDVDVQVMTIDKDADYNKRIDYMAYRRPEVYRY